MRNDHNSFFYILQIRGTGGKNTCEDQLSGLEKKVKILQEAVRDMHYLLSRGFAENASAGEKELKARNTQKIEAAILTGKTIYIDGFNLLILLESLLSGAYFLKVVTAATAPSPVYMAVIKGCSKQPVL